MTAAKSYTLFDEFERLVSGPLFSTNCDMSSSLIGNDILRSIFVLQKINKNKSYTFHKNKTVNPFLSLSLTGKSCSTGTA